VKSGRECKSPGCRTGVSDIAAVVLLRAWGHHAGMGGNLEFVKII
jgi:hypothetical protein